MLFSDCLLQFTYRANRSTDDDITLALHMALSHLEWKNNNKLMLFVDYSSAFNTLIPAKLVTYRTWVCTAICAMGSWTDR